MKRFFLIPLLALLLGLVGCTCSVRGSASMPTKAPTAMPTASATPKPIVTATPQMTTAPTETAAPVMPTEPIASPSASSTAGN
ncbi:MAG: hypothetical protein IJI34_00930 [Clostridia bacterium]|nr:hypothetical protein [Clostridia bacterium]